MGKYRAHQWRYSCHISRLWGNLKFSAATAATWGKTWVAWVRKCKSGMKMKDSPNSNTCCLITHITPNQHLVPMRKVISVPIMQVIHGTNTHTHTCTHTNKYSVSPRVPSLLTGYHGDKSLALYATNSINDDRNSAQTSQFVTSGECLAPYMRLQMYKYTHIYRQNSNQPGKNVNLTSGL